jgi:hypothetical protein
LMNYIPFAIRLRDVFNVKQITHRGIVLGNCG